MIKVANSRTKLAKYDGSRIYCQATFNRLAHRKLHGGSQKTTMLLTNVALSDAKGIFIKELADHVWVDFNRGIATDVQKELFTGDTVLFSATVNEYSINRDNITKKRHNRYKQYEEKRTQIYQKYRERYLDWLNEAADLKANDKLANDYYHSGQITYDDMKQIQKENHQIYQSNKPTLILDKHIKESSFNKQVKHNKAYQSIDFQLTRIKNFQIIKRIRPKHGWHREKYKIKQFSNLKYTKYLSARSSAYLHGTPYDQF